MTLCSDLADYTWLTSAEAGAILDELAGDSAPLHTKISQLRRRVSPAQAHLLVEQAELRRRAAEKFTQAHRMFFTRTGLEQATDEWIARYKAQRFTSHRAQQAGLLGTRRGEASPPPVSAAPSFIADLCCGIGGDLIALAENTTVVGVDRDPIIAQFAAANSGARVDAADVVDFDISAIDAWHIDPDRRASGRRTTSLQFCEPNVETIERLLAKVPNAAIKLAPATEAPADWAAQCELEWISRDRECRQLVAWHGDLAVTPGRHRATIIPISSSPASRGVPAPDPPRTIVGPPNVSTPITSNPDRFLFDVDPAVLAARLQGALAAEHGLQSLAPARTYFTGSSAIADTALSCFEVEDVLPLRTRTLAQHLHARGVGRLEIKKRGVDVDPEKLRRELKLRGDNAATLLVTRVAGRPAAILAHRVAF